MKKVIIKEVNTLFLLKHHFLSLFAAQTPSLLIFHLWAFGNWRRELEVPGTLCYNCTGLSQAAPGCLWNFAECKRTLHAGGHSARHLPKRVASGREERAEVVGALDRAALFLLDTWSAFALGQGKEGVWGFVFSTRIQNSVTQALTLCPFIFMAEPFCCEILIFHAFEIFREELGSRMGTLLLEGSGLLCLAHSRQRRGGLGGLIGRDVWCPFSFRLPQAPEPLLRMAVWTIKRDCPSCRVKAPGRTSLPSVGSHYVSRWQLTSFSSWCHCYGVTFHC